MPKKSLCVLSAGTDTGLSDRDAVTNNRLPEFSGTAPAGGRITLYRDTNGNGLIEPGEQVWISGPTWSPLVVGADGTFSFRVGPTQPLGVHGYLLAVQDPAGNVTIKALTVQIETLAPLPLAITMVAATDSGYFSTDKATNNTTPAFEVALAPSLQVGATIDFQIRDTSATTSVERARLSHQITQADIDAGRVLFEVPAGSELPNRTLYVAARTIDLAGNESGWKGMNLG